MTARIYEFPTPNDERRQARGTRSLHRRSAASAGRRRPVSNKAQDWAWTQPVRGTRQHVLLALAKRAKPKTEVAVPSMPELAEMTGLTENTIRAHIKALVTMRLVRIEQSNGGRHKRSRYTLMVDSTVASGSPTPQEMQGSGGDETPQQMRPSTPQQVRGEEVETPHLTKQNPSADAPVVLRTKGGTRGVSTKKVGAVAPTDTYDGGMFPEPVTAMSEAKKRNNLAQAITNSYQRVVPLSNRPAILMVIRKAVDAELYSGEQINAAALRVAADGRSLTTETLRIELEGFGERRASIDRFGGTRQQGTATKRARAFLDLPDEDSA